MTTDHIAGVLLVIGAVVFGVGAAVGVPRVFTERDPVARLRMLEERQGMWRMAQPLYGLGPAIASAGVGSLAAEAPARMDRGHVRGCLPGDGRRCADVVVVPVLASHPSLQSLR